MRDLEVLKRAVTDFLRSKKLVVFQDAIVPRISGSNISEVAAQLYTIYRLLMKGEKDVPQKMFPEGVKVDILAWYEGRKVPAFAISLSQRSDEELAKGMDDLASYYKLVVHLEEMEPKRVGNVIIISYRDLEEHIATMLTFLSKR